MNIFISFCLVFVIPITFLAQGSYAPNASLPGTTAIFKDSSIIVTWANQCTVNRGPKNITDASLGFATAGNENNATGKSGVNGIVSLGDGGEAILTFDHPVFDGVGNDFAVFENSFNDTFLELAFVEVSTDGVTYVRFPNYSETQDTLQIDGFGEIEATNIYNLAGKYRVGYGTPFDLAELIDSSGIDINNINYIKIVDVIGIINDPNTNFDNSLNQINDPFPTPYPSSGFDLDAVGVIHQFVGVNEVKNHSQLLYPNPTKNNFTLEFNVNGEKFVSITNYTGKLIYSITTSENVLNFKNELIPGVYLIKTEVKGDVLLNKLLVY